MNPKVTILMPVYNGEKYLVEAIESILNQTYKDFEFLIINDGSTDNTESIIRKYVGMDSRVKYLFQKNGGQGKARNFGISISRGVFIAFIDSDDVWMVDKLEQQLKLFCDQSVGLVYCDAENIYQDQSRHQRRSELFKCFSGNVTRKIIQNNFITNSSVIVRKNILNASGLFNESSIFRTVEDYDLWLRISILCNIAYLDKILLKYRYELKVKNSLDRAMCYKRISAVYFGILGKKRFLKFSGLIFFKAFVYYFLFIFFRTINIFFI